MLPAFLLRLEGLALFACAVFFYRNLNGGWIVFGALFFWPDIFMLGYLAGPKWGSRCYNLVHSEVLPAVLGTCAFALHQTFLLGFALIWLSHIGFDRVFGYGLKYPTFFKDTHLQRLS